MKARPCLVLVILAALPVLVLAQVRLVPGPHEVLTPIGPQAAHIAALWNVFLGVCTAVFVVTFAAFLYALWRKRPASAATPPDLSMLNRHERWPYRVVLGAVALAVLLLFVLLWSSVRTDQALARLPLDDALHLTVTGHQWWWEVRYDGDPASQIFTTANELHVPVGRPVIVTLQAGDVIHSLWVPMIDGKKDLIPGRTALIRFRADRSGTYRGQCAEFCGFQHAYMAFEVIADPPERYAAWATRQRQPAPEPAAAELKRGQQVFLGSTCVMCHSIEGTIAGARFGPDLTHVGGRSTLAAGTLANTADELKRWIRNPQQIKPGVNMPSSSLPDADLDALVAYLGSLK